MRTGDVDQLGRTAVRIHDGDLIHSQTADEDRASVRAHRERMRPREEDIDLLDGHVRPTHDSDPVGRIHRAHRASDEEPVPHGIDSHHARHLEFGTGDESVFGVELEYPVLPDQGDIPTGAVRLRHDMMGFRVRTEAQIPEIDRPHHPTRFGVDDRDRGVVLVRHVEAPLRRVGGVITYSLGSETSARRGERDEQKGREPRSGKVEREHVVISARVDQETAGVSRGLTMKRPSRPLVTITTPLSKNG